MSGLLFESLELRDFGPFRGKQEVLLGTDADRNVVLFEGGNAQGKTLFSLALKFLVFGNEIPEFARTEYFGIDSLLYMYSKFDYFHVKAKVKFEGEKFELKRAYNTRIGKEQVHLEVKTASKSQDELQFNPKLMFFNNERTDLNKMMENFSDEEKVSAFKRASELYKEFQKKEANIPFTQSKQLLKQRGNHMKLSIRERQLFRLCHFLTLNKKETQPIILDTPLRIIDEQNANTLRKHLAKRKHQTILLEIGQTEHIRTYTNIKHKYQLKPTREKSVSIIRRNK